MSDKCNVDGCSRDAKAKGLCMAHYKRAWRGSASALAIGERPPQRKPTPRVINTRLPSALEAKLVAAAPPGELYRFLRHLIQAALSCQRCRARASKG